MPNEEGDRIDVVRRGYDALSLRYRADDAETGRYAPWIAELLTALGSGSRVLDLGCGCGIPVARDLAAAGHDVVGVDVSDVQVQRARRLVPGARFVRADATSLELPRESYDAVVALYSLIHIPLAAQRALLASIAGWLVDGGLLLLTAGWDARTGSESGWLGGDVEMWWSHADVARYRSWLMQSGFEVIREEFVPERDGGHSLFWARRLKHCARAANVPRPMDAVALRAQFPVLERLAFLNAGTDGPVAAAAVAAAREALEAQRDGGRYSPHFETRFALQAELRALYARVLGCDTDDVALKTSTSEGLGTVLGGLELGPGDEIVTSDSEHPGLIGPLLAARARGVKIKAVPLRDVADAVSASTTLVACSHVSWVTGEVAPAALATVDVPVVLDGAQGAGAVSVDVRSLGCAAYAASGQKWLCGADGTGMLYVAPIFRERVRAIAPSYVCFEDARRGLDAELRADARRYDTPSLSREAAAFSLTATRLLADAGLDAVQARATELAARLAGELAERGRVVAPRGMTTLVSFEDPDPPATRERLAAAGVVMRDLPGTPFVRASVGAWNDDGDLERLLDAL